MSNSLLHLYWMWYFKLRFLYLFLPFDLHDSPCLHRLLFDFSKIVRSYEYFSFCVETRPQNWKEWKKLWITFHHFYWNSRTHSLSTYFTEHEIATHHHLNVSSFPCFLSECSPPKCRKLSTRWVCVVLRSERGYFSTNSQTGKQDFYMDI